MKNKTLHNFADSAYNSPQEKSFLEKELKGYYQEKQKSKYAEILANKHNVEPGGKPSYPTSSKKKYVYITAFFVLIALLITAVMMYLKPSETSVQQMYAANMYIEMEGATRGTISENEQVVEKLNKSYENRQYAAVISAFENLDSNFEKNTNTLVRAAIAYASENKFSQAEVLFLEAKSTANALQLQEINWAMLNFYLVQDKKVEAQEILDKMKSTDYKHREALNLLKK